MRIPERLWARNHRGRRVPRVLGIGIAAGTAITFLTMAAAGLPPSAEEAIAAGGAGLVFLAGLIDDLVPIGPRGLRGHLRELGAGRMTTGILKLLVTAGAAVVVVASTRPSGWLAGLAAVVVVMGTTNVWNGLDVRPGRALKAFLVALSVLALVGTGPVVGAPLLVAMSPWALVALVPDLRERAMLGDSGANLVGFALGVGIADAVPPSWLWVAAVAAVALNVVADTVSFSRVIDAVAPLRWFDRLGALPGHGTG